MAVGAWRHMISSESSRWRMEDVADGVVGAAMAAMEGGERHGMGGARGRKGERGQNDRRRRWRDEARGGPYPSIGYHRIAPVK